MILRIDVDLDNPVATKILLDGKQVGGLQRVNLVLDMHKDLFLLDVCGLKMREAREKGFKTFSALGYFFKTHVSRLLSDTSEYSKKTLEEVLEALRGNLSTK